MVNKKTLDIHISDSSIGTLNLNDGLKLGNLCICGTSVIGISCRGESQGGTFGGSIQFKNLWLPRNIQDYFIENAQPYRNLISHLLAANNYHASSVVHGPMLSVEREEYSNRIEKFVNRTYECFSDYGYSLWRPVCWIIGLFFVTALFCFYFDAVTYSSDLSIKSDWRSSLSEQSMYSQALRAVVVAFQPMSNPLSLFGDKILVAKDLWFAIWLGIHSIFSVILITLFILVYCLINSVKNTIYRSNDFICRFYPSKWRRLFVVRIEIRSNGVFQSRD